jgi:tRNA/tmRNA/rRNA uracil-C5-methylase (TrmA/RlmC/RlmD family)
LEIGPISFKEKASRRLGGDHKPSTKQIRNDKHTEAREGKLQKPERGAILLSRDADDVVETNQGLTFRFQAGNFFQNNPCMLPKMVDLAVDATTKQPAGGAI